MKKTKNKSNSLTSRLPFNFEGVSGPNYTQVPDQIIDFVMPYLSGAETKVLMYIIRRTFGFKKDADKISIRQMVEGITTREGRVLDLGTGLSKASVITALKGLTEMNIVRVEKLRTDERGDETNTYSLNHKEESQALVPKSAKGFTPVEETNTRVQKLDTPRVQKLDTPRVQKLDTPRVQKLDTQETVKQETVKQETVKQETAATTTGTSEVMGTNHQNVVVALVAFGITRKIAEKFASAKESQYLQEKLSYAKFLIESAPEKIKNPNGWLRKAIEEDWGAPDGFISQADREEEERQLEIEQQRQREFARREAARHEAKARQAEENYTKWRDDLSEEYATTAADFEMWERALVGLKTAFIGNEITYKSFVASAEILSVQDDKVLVGVGTQLAVDKLNHRNNVLFEREFKFIFKKPMKVEFIVVGRPDPVLEEIVVENETVTISKG